MALRIAVLISGEGTNLQALIDQLHGRGHPTTGHRQVEIAGVVSNRADARGLERARAAGIETGIFTREDHGGGRSADNEGGDRAARDSAIGDWLEQRRVELVVLAGFMEMLSPDFVRRFEGRIVNVHPSLLPAFPGVAAIRQAVDHGVRVTGVTVHFVDEGIDSGTIILQRALELPYAADIAAVEHRLHEIEHELLPRAVTLIAEGKVELGASHGSVEVAGAGD